MKIETKPIGDGKFVKVNFSVRSFEVDQFSYLDHAWEEPYSDEVIRPTLDVLMWTGYNRQIVPWRDS